MTCMYIMNDIKVRSMQMSLVVQEFTQLCYRRDLPRAMKALESMERQGLWADSITYSQLLKCCLSLNALQPALRLHRHLFSHPASYQPNTFLSNVLLSMYVKFGLLREAQSLFDKIPHRDVVSWTTLISAYSASKSDAHLKRKAFDSLLLMLRQGLRPNMFTYSSVLRACPGLFSLRQLHCSIIKDGLHSHVFVRSALIDFYSKWGELGNALCIFDEIVTRDLVVWNSIIAGFAQNNQGDEALNLFKRMKRDGLVADHSTLTSVLRGCTGLTLLELGRQVHAHVLKYYRDLILDNSLLDMYCKCGCLEDANVAFNRMAHKDVISWSTMIAGLAQNGYSRQALKFFESMKASGTKPNHITILGVLFACSHAGLVEDGWYYFRSMKRLFGFDPGREHFGCMIDLLGRAGKLDEAVRLINEMKIEPDIVTWKTLLGACKVHRNVELAVHAAQRILRLDPEDAGTYILLSNVYANTHRWNDVARIRRIMDDMGIRKEPGCSWIEVDKKIHAFILGDNSHPRINEINIELDKLMQKLATAGYVPDVNFVLQDLEGEQREDSLRYHSEKLALVFGLMSLPREQTIRIRKNLRICGDCHLFAKLVAKVKNRPITIRDPVRYHHFRDGLCSCGDYW